MDTFAGRRAVVTGGGSGMGRELVIQLANQGCSVATCDVSEVRLAETLALAAAGAPDGTSVSTHRCDVSDEAQVLAFRQAVQSVLGGELHLLFNNAGVGGAGSFVTDSREEWERVFGVDWWGVYYCTRAFLPMLMAADRATLVNTSSVNGFWAALAPGIPHTAYSTAKFAVKGFSEALIEDLRVNAPHVNVAVVMPGHIGTDIVANSRRYLGMPEPDAMTDDDVETMRDQLVKRNMPVGDLPADQLRGVLKTVEEMFRTSAPTSPAQAATVILDGVRSNRWRILVGEDAHRLDEQVRADPEHAYEPGAMGMGSLGLRGAEPASGI
jgi:NAD(P)-dependent dehydrogenase (short-subunit alcohol dehydrogenase family)